MTQPALEIRNSLQLGSPNSPAILPYLKSSLIFGQAPTVWFSYGDSVETLTGRLMVNLWKMFRFGGCALGDCFAVLASGSIVVASSLWINGEIYESPEGGTIVFGKDFGGGVLSPVRSTSLKVFSIADETGGTFQFQYSSDNGETWADSGSPVDCYDATGPRSIVLEATLPKAAYLIRVVGVTGTCQIVGASLINTTEGGIVWARASRGGISLSMMLAPPVEITGPIIASLAPSMFTYNEKTELGWTPEMLGELMDRSFAAHPASDWLLFGTHPVNPATQDDARQIVNNERIRELAFARKCSHFSIYEIIVSYERGNSAGLYLDDVHLNDMGDSYVASDFLAWSGLLSLNEGAPANMRRTFTSISQRITFPLAHESVANEVAVETGKVSGGVIGFYDSDQTLRGLLSVLGNQGFGGSTMDWSKNAFVWAIPGCEAVFTAGGAISIGPDRRAPTARLTIDGSVEATAFL